MEFRGGCVNVRVAKKNNRNKHEAARRKENGEFTIYNSCLMFSFTVMIYVF